MAPPIADLPVDDGIVPFKDDNRPEFGPVPDFPEPARKPNEATTFDWRPRLNPSQDNVINDAALFILSYGEKGCRSLDTQVYLADGLERLSNLKPEGAIPGGFTAASISLSSFETSELRFCEAIADAYWSEPGNEAMRAELAHGGELIGSPRHPIWVCFLGPDGSHGFGYWRLEQILEKMPAGWRFWTPFVGHAAWTKSEIQRFEEIAITPGVAYALGALAGDGSLNSLHNHAGFTNNDPECIEAAKGGLAEAGLKLNKINAKYQFNILPGPDARRLLRGVGLEGLSYTKRIPDIVVRSPKPVAAAFLSGLFDTDGTVDKAGNVQFCTTSDALGRDVQDILAAFGILCIRRPKKSASGRPTWTLSLHGKNAWKFSQEIGFRITRKQNRILGERRSFRCPNGFNANRYGYPDPIRSALKKIVLASRDGKRTRKWHNENRRLHSFGSVPSKEKVDALCSIYGCGEAIRHFRVSDNWLEIVRITKCQSELADLRVLGTHSFLAAGTINHNSGKSIGGLNALVRHCFEENDALALIIAPQIRTGKEGVMYDLEWVLDIWQNGNWDPDNPGKRLDDGMGLDFTQPTLDPNTKDRCMYIGNQHGGWSKVILMSIPYEEVVEKRMKALSPSFVLVDEITELQGKAFFTYITQQLGRRRGISGPQQYVASCNPEGPSHWVYQVWWVDCVDSETGKRDPDYSVYHIPIHENKKNLPKGYVEKLHKIYKDDIDRARLLEGRWIDRPAGDAIFRQYWRKEINVIGDALKNEGLTPLRGFPIIIGYDPGPVNFCVTFMQCIPAKDKVVWVIFDELNFVGEFAPDYLVVARVLETMDFWKEFLVGSDVSFVHISDEASFTHRRPDGTYDATRILQLSKNRIRMRACPKGKESVPSRVQMVITMLLSETIYVSALCPRTIEMFRLLSSEPRKDDKYDPNAGLTPKRSVYLHPFDALSYPPYYMTLHPARFAAQISEVEKPTSKVFRAGSG